MVGRINDIRDIHVAENPKPLKPLIIEAINTVSYTHLRAHET